MPNAVNFGPFRFSLLRERVLRLEYSSRGSFEDRTSFRAANRPPAIPFSSCIETGETLRLESAVLSITCNREAELSALESLRIEHPFGTWSPLTVDKANLGGSHCSLDCINEHFIPSGVHPASAKFHDNGSHWSLWNYKWRAKGEQRGEVESEDRYRGLSLGKLVSETDPADWPPRLRELIDERRKYPPGLLSRSGYFLLNDTESPLFDPESGWLCKRPAQEGYQDWYFFAYGNDFKAALRDYRALSGKTPLLPRYALGLWYSRYPTGNQDELIETVESFEAKGLPLSLLVLDLEWHRHGWSGWDWDTGHIPDPKGLLQLLKKRRIRVTLNLHPEQVPVNDSRAEAFLSAAGIEDSARVSVKDNHGGEVYAGCYFSDDSQHMKAFMEVLHDPVKKDGIDFWWMDGLVQLKDCPGQDAQSWTNHVYQQHALKHFPNERPMVMARTAGFGTHRYPFHFTGDTYSQWPVLKSSVEFLLRSGHIGQSYMTHDIGGHIGDAGKTLPEDLYLRWVQFGSLSPICRLHSAGGERRPWKYSFAVQEGVRASMELRRSLVPYLYSLARESSEQGYPICRSNPLEAPDWDRGYCIWDQYFIGDRLYAAPILDETDIPPTILPPGGWYCGLTGHYYHSDGSAEVPKGGDWKQAPPHFFKAGTIMVKQAPGHPVDPLPDTFHVHCFIDAKVNSRDTFVLYEDDGETRDFERGSYAETAFRLEVERDSVNVNIQPRHRCRCLPQMPENRSYTITLHEGKNTSSIEVTNLPREASYEVHFKRQQA